MSNLLQCQGQESRRARRFVRLRQLLGLIHEHKIRLGSSELEQAVMTMFEAAQETMDNHETFEMAMSLLCEITGGRPELVNQTVRLAWLEKAYRWQHIQASKSTPDVQELQNKMLTWMRIQADRGYLKGLALPAEYLTPGGRSRLIGSVLEPALEFLGDVLQNDLACVEAAAQTMIEAHLLGRAGSLNMGIKRGNRGIEGFVRRARDAGRGEVAERVWSKAYASVTGGVPAIASLMEIPRDLVLVDVDRDFAQAQKTLQRSLAHKSAYRLNQLGGIRETLAASSLLIDELVASGSTLDQSFARALFRLVRDGPFKPKVDPGFVDIKKAVIYIFRRLAVSNELVRIPDRIQGEGLKALLRFSSRPSDVDLFAHVYRQMAPRDGQKRSWKWASSSQKQFSELVDSATDKHTHSSILLAVELYAHWLSDELPPFRPSVRERIVRALAQIDDENIAGHLRGLHRGPHALAGRAVMVDLLRQAIADTGSERVSRIYAQIIVEHDSRKVGRTKGNGITSSEGINGADSTQ